MKYPKNSNFHMKFNLSLFLVLILCITIALFSSCKDKVEPLNSSGYGNTTATIPTQNQKKDDNQREKLFKDVDSKNINGESTYVNPKDPHGPSVSVFEGNKKTVNPEEEAKIDEQLAKLRENSILHIELLEEIKWKFLFHLNQTVSNT